MPQPFLALFAFDIDATTPLAERTGILNAIQAEFQRPNRRFQPRLINAWLARFDDGGFNAFIQQMDTLRSQHPGFRYLSVGWNAMIPVVLNPTGPVAHAITGPLVALPLKSSDFTLSQPSEAAAGEVPANDRPARRRAADTRQPANVRKGKRPGGSPKSRSKSKPGSKSKPRSKPEPGRKPRGRTR